MLLKSLNREINKDYTKVKKVSSKFYKFLKQLYLEEYKTNRKNSIQDEIEKERVKIKKVDGIVICPDLKKGTFRDIKNIIKIYFSSLEQKILENLDTSKDLTNIFLFSEQALRYSYEIEEKKVLQICKKFNELIAKNNTDKTKNLMFFCIEQQHLGDYANMAYFLDGKKIKKGAKKLFTFYDYHRIRSYEQKVKFPLTGKWGRKKTGKFLTAYSEKNKIKIEHRICADAIYDIKKPDENRVLLISAKSLSTEIELKLFANLEKYRQIIINDADEGSYSLKIERKMPKITGADKTFYLITENKKIQLDIFYI
ncbi:MAG: hypothetical protein N3D10_03110 [Candidatus Micrarchaeota archaeon]|nr:hypothetical protein [Candidatus Micrarchaeota archaeon]